jgi:hypothetical protein
VNRVTREDNIVYEDTFPYMVTRGSTILAAPMEECKHITDMYMHGTYIPKHAQAYTFR